MAVFFLYFRVVVVVSKFFQVGLHYTGPFDILQYDISPNRIYVPSFDSISTIGGLYILSAENLKFLFHLNILVPSLIDTFIMLFDFLSFLLASEHSCFKFNSKYVPYARQWGHILIILQSPRTFGFPDIAELIVMIFLAGKIPFLRQCRRLLRIMLGSYNYSTTSSSFVKVGILPHFELFQAPLSFMLNNIYICILTCGVSGDPMRYYIYNKSLS